MVGKFRIRDVFVMFPIQLLSFIFQMRAEESKFVEKLNLSSTEGPKKIKGCVRLWQTDGVHTRLFFSPNGSAVAASGAHNSVQV